MEAVPKSDMKFVIKSDIRFDISIKRTTWIGQQSEKKTFLKIVCPNKREREAVRMFEIYRMFIVQL